MRRFTAPDLCRTNGAKINNTRKFLRSLARHGYITLAGEYIGGRAGSYQGWRLIRDTGPVNSSCCRRCGRPLCDPCERSEDVE